MTSEAPEKAEDQMTPLPPWRGDARARLLAALEQFVYDMVGLPTATWPAISEAAHATALHRFYRRHFWRKPTAPLRAIAALVVWPLALAFTVIQYTWRNGSAIRLRSGTPVPLQIMQQVKHAACHAIAPPWYYMFELFLPERAKHSSEYLTAHETIAGAYELFEPAANRDAMSDKVWFAEHCRMMGIRAVPVLIYGSEGKLRFLYPESDPAHDVDYFVKPRSGSGGHRAERWDRVGDGRFRNSRGLTLTRADLYRYLEQQALGEDIIVQPRLINHAGLDDIANGALSTLRVLTCLNEQGVPEATNVAFRMAIGSNTVVDNFHQGGLASPMDMMTGRIGPASDIGRYPAMGWRQTHPVSGAAFVDRQLPYWQEAIALAIAAARAFPHRVAIGWDVAMLNDGPCIVEGNGKPDLDIHQRCEQRPLGKARIAALLAWHVEKTRS